LLFETGSQYTAQAGLEFSSSASQILGLQMCACFPPHYRSWLPSATLLLFLCGLSVSLMSSCVEKMVPIVAVLRGSRTFKTLETRCSDTLL
jgi:hypothetical protein